MEGCAPEGTALRVLFLNLMPQKAVTELDFVRMMVGAGRDVEFLPVKFRGQTFKTTPMEHIVAFYRDVEEAMADGTHYDGLIITGAPVEHLPFEEVRYWEELCRLMDWADANVQSTLYVCWGAQAGLYHHYGVPKYGLPSKMFGIFEQTVHSLGNELMRGLEPAFLMPNSRHTEVRAADMANKGLHILASSPESGVGVVCSDDNRRVFIVGHLEYESRTLEREYLRDVAKGLPIEVPRHYYEADNPGRPILFAWEQAAKLFYANWIRTLA